MNLIGNWDYIVLFSIAGRRVGGRGYRVPLPLKLMKMMRLGMVIKQKYENCPLARMMLLRGVRRMDSQC